MARRRKNPHAVALAKLAHEGRMKRITPARRREIAKIANAARWGQARQGQGSAAMKRTHDPDPYVPKTRRDALDYIAFCRDAYCEYCR